MRHRWKRWWKPLSLVVLGVTIGGIGRGFLPPFELDDPFWRDFWSGPPTAGIFAVIGAGVAFAAALLGARTARRAAERQEWWDRAEWALTLARSDQSADRVIGLSALRALVRDATETEEEMVIAVVSTVTGVMDSKSEVGENDTKKRRFPWTRTG